MTQRLRIALGFPGPSMSYAAHLGLRQATDGRHKVKECWCELGAWDAFNALWVDALNMQEAGEIDLFAMLHSDSDPEPHWLDTLIDEMERTEADYVSVVSPIKDARGLCDVAIAESGNPWGCLRRFTTRELAKLPETVDAAALGYPGQCLLQGDGCMVVDLRKPVFHQVDSNGQAKVCFNFPTQVLRGQSGKWIRRRESEDWYFSRRLFEAGGRAVATRKVCMAHHGDYGFPNWYGWGSYLHGDEETRSKWDQSGEIIGPHGEWRHDEAKRHRHDPELAKALVEFLRGSSVVDLGCGTGGYVRELKAAGVSAVGFDGSPNTPQLSGGVCGIQDLTEPFDAGRFDWVLNLEVMEHIPPDLESAALDNITQHATRGIILSWAQPDQGPGEHGHVNERPVEEVLDIMAARGFECDESASATLRQAATVPWFRENLRVYRRV